MDSFFALRAARADSVALTTAAESDVYERLTTGLGRLRSLLVAISYDVALVDKIKAPPSRLAAVVDEMIDRSALERTRVERQILEDAFSSIDDVLLQDLVDEDPFPGSVRGHRWIVAIPPVAWEQAVKRRDATRSGRSGGSYHPPLHGW